MNEQNLENLKNSLKYLGFNEALNYVMERAIKKGLTEFNIGFSNSVNPHPQAENGVAGRDFISYELRFSKHKDPANDTYYFNSYTARLQRAGELHVREQRFDLSRDRFTAKEAYNLLSGRSVLKEMKPAEENAAKVPVWKKLELNIMDAWGSSPVREFGPAYKFDLEATVARYPLRAFSDAEQQSNMMAHLKKGNLASAELVIEGHPYPVFVAANPEMKSLDVFDHSLKPMRNDAIFAAAKADPVQSQEVSETNSSKTSKTKSAAKAQESRPWENGPAAVPGQQQQGR